jgi:hypothetical protein
MQGSFNNILDSGNIQRWLKHFASNVVQRSKRLRIVTLSTTFIFACTSCEYITEGKVHPDCRNAEILAKTPTTAQEGSTITAASTISGPRSTTGNQQQQQSIVKSKEEISKAEQSSAPSYLTTEQDNDKNSNINPFTAGAAAWQSLVTYWMYIYGEFLKKTEEWCNVFWKPWVIGCPRKGDKMGTE